MFDTTKKLKSRLELLESTLNRVISERDELNKRLGEATHDKEQDIKAIRLDHELALKKKQFEIDHLESDQLSLLRAELVSLQKEIAVANTKLELMAKVTDVNADVLDVKDLVTKLIEKMPTININSIIAGLSGTKSEAKE